MTNNSCRRRQFLLFIYLFIYLLEKASLDISCESIAKQRIHMKCQYLFSLLQILLGALMVKWILRNFQLLYLIWNCSVNGWYCINMSYEPSKIFFLHILMEMAYKVLSERKVQKIFKGIPWKNGIHKRSKIHHENIPICFWPPLTPLLYSKTGVYRGIHYFSYFCS